MHKQLRKASGCQFLTPTHSAQACLPAHTYVHLHTPPTPPHLIHVIKWASILLPQMFAVPVLKVNDVDEQCELTFYYST